MTCPIAGQVMVAVLIRQRLAHCQQYYDLLQQLDLQATLYGSFVVFFETGRVFNGIFGFFHLFRSAKLNRNPSFQFASLSSDLANRLLSCIINIFSRTIYMQFSGFFSCYFFMLCYIGENFFFFRGKRLSVNCYQTFPWF